MDAIVLAAGYSSRTGTYKMALEMNKKAVLAHVVEAFYPFCEQIIVVGGHYFQETEAIVAGYSKVLLIKNERYDQGMFTSVKAGARVSHGDFFVTPGDYPMISKETCGRLKGAFEEGKKKGHELLIPTYNGKRGHPILLGGHLKEPLLKEGDESNLRLFQTRYRTFELEVGDQGILMDLDTMEDYGDLKKMMEERCGCEDPILRKTR